MIPLTAQGVEPSDDIEEVVVIAAKNMWDGARWFVQATQHLPGSLHLGAGRSPVDTWELTWVLRCEVSGVRHAACDVEDVSLVVESTLHPARDAAEWVLAERERLADLVVHVGFDDGGELSVTDVVGLKSGDGLATVVELGMVGFAAIELPRGPLEDGAIWWRRQDPMLRLPGLRGVVSQTQVNHFGNLRGGRYVVQSVGRLGIAKVDMPSGSEIPEPMRVVRDDGRVVSGRAHVGAFSRSVSWYDLYSRFLLERSVRVEGYPGSSYHEVTVRRLTSVEEVPMPSSGVRPVRGP